MSKHDKSNDQFVHLHVHSEYSILDGASKVKEIVETVAKDGNPGIGISDHGSMGGIVKLFKEAKAAGVTAVPGMEAYHSVSAKRTAKDEPSEYLKETEAQKSAKAAKDVFHLSLFGVTNQGYRNLMKVTSKAWTEGYYYKPRTDDAALAQHSEGLVALSGCLGSRYNQALLSHDIAGAEKILGDHRDIFGKDKFFIEIMDHNIPDQDFVVEYHLKHSKKFGIPLIATNDSHYTHDHEHEKHDALLCMNTRSTLANENRFRFQGDQTYYMRTAKEMYDLFPEEDFPNACKNTLLIAEMAQDITSPVIDPDNPKYLLPEFPFDSRQFTNDTEALRFSTYHGLKEHYGERLPQAVIERADYELGVIDSMGFNAYFLIVGDMIQWAKKQNIAIGPGRGSGAGSIVAYANKITNIDPLRYGLYFERFLNPDRVSMPDIDTDVESARRQEVVDYLVERWGIDRVAQIGTYGAMKPKSAIKSAGRIMGISVSDVNNVSKLYPGVINGKEEPLKNILTDEPATPELKDAHAASRKLRELYKSSPSVKEMLDLASSVEGIKNLEGKHPAGVIISPGPMSQYAPIRSEAHKGNHVPITQYDMQDVEEVGLVKLDLLGLSNLSIIKEAVELIQLDTGEKVDVDNLPLDDEKVYELLANGDTLGVFQVEGEGISGLLRRLKPTKFDDIPAVLSLYRPGPMGTDQHLKYADIKNGRIKAEVIHEDMHELLKDSLSVLTYQEQLIALVRHYAGMTAAQGDVFRKAVGKKDAEKLAKQEVIFKEGCKTTGIVNEATANKLWDMIPPFAQYSFNKSHAVAYGFVTYQTAWLKANYPAQFVAACINVFSQDKSAQLVAYARNLGIGVYQPDVNVSVSRTTTKNNNIVLGIGGISNCGGSAVGKILEDRRYSGKFKSLQDFCGRLKGVNKTAVYQLISSGAFDKLHNSRKLMHENLEYIKDYFSSNGYNVSDDDDLFGELEFETLVDKVVLDGKEYTKSDKLALEVQALGFFASEHPFAEVREKLPELIEAGLIPENAEPADSPNLIEGQNVSIFGIANQIQEMVSKAKRPYMKFVLETGTGDSLKVTHWGKIYNLRPGDLVLLEGATLEAVESGPQEGGNPDEVAEESTKVAAISRVASIVALGGDKEQPRERREVQDVDEVQEAVSSRPSRSGRVQQDAKPERKRRTAPESSPVSSEAPPRDQSRTRASRRIRNTEESSVNHESAPTPSAAPVARRSRRGSQLGTATVDAPVRLTLVFDTEGQVNRLDKMLVASRKEPGIKRSEIIAKLSGDDKFERDMGRFYLSEHRVKVIAEGSMCADWTSEPID